MVSQELIQVTNKHAEKAFAQINAQGYLPVPEVYELWYVYYAKSNADVTRAIDILESKGEKIDYEKCMELHERYLTEKTQQARIETASQNIENTIKDVAFIVSDVKESANEYQESLSNATMRLSDQTNDVKIDEINEIISEILETTKQMTDKNSIIEGKLANSMLRMLEMQHDLEAVKKEVYTDGLTNIANRKAFDFEIKRMIDNVNDGTSESFSLILLDIDHFKAFNDKFGHQVGDQVLKLVAKALVEGVKGRDMAARYGGEEFAILLPSTPVNGCQLVANSLRAAVEKKEVINRLTGELLARITISGGAAEFIKGEDLEDFIYRTDRALYKAKERGRNQIVVAEAAKIKQS